VTVREMSEAIRDVLRMKDDARVQSAKLSPTTTMSREEALQYLFTKQQEKAYEIAMAAKCI